MEWKQNVMPEEYGMFTECGYSDLTAVTLCKAGIKDLDGAAEFLVGDTLLDPGRIRNIDAAAEMIWKHIYADSKICVFGDYDTDGITASAIMFLALKRLGADCTVRLPDRIEEGYGISMAAIDEQLDTGVKLFVTVDNGIRANKETEYVKEKGCDIVILDHHEPGDVLPEADAVVDLHIPGETYPFIELTGSAVAWKVAHYMLEQMGEHDFAMSLIDLAAIGTVGDVAPLIGENRVIVKRALKRMSQYDYDRFGVIAIMKSMSGITAEDIAFRLAPCLNAPGRLCKNGASLPLILLLESDPKIAEQLAEQVIAENEHRKDLQAKCYESVRAAAEERIHAGDKVLVIRSDEAPNGIVGLLAGNLKEEFSRPAIVFGAKADKDGVLHYVGSARSIEAFHMLNAIEQCSEYLERYGGHKLAAGLTISQDDATFEAFRSRINEIADSLTRDDITPNGLWDIELTEADINDDLFAEMKTLEPFGAGAPKPVIKVNAHLSAESHKFMGNADQHIKLFCDGFSLVGFGMAEKYIGLELPETLTAYGSLRENIYRGFVNKEIALLDISA